MASVCEDCRGTLCPYGVEWEKGEPPEPMTCLATVMCADRPTVVVLRFESCKWWEGYPGHYEPFKDEVLRWAPMPKPAQLE